MTAWLSGVFLCSVGGLRRRFFPNTLTFVNIPLFAKFGLVTLFRLGYF